MPPSTLRTMTDPARWPRSLLPRAQRWVGWRTWDESVSFAVIGDWGTGEVRTGRRGQHDQEHRLGCRLRGDRRRQQLRKPDPRQLRVGRTYWAAVTAISCLAEATTSTRLQTSGTQRFFPSVGNHDSAGGGGTIAGYVDYFHTDPGRPGPSAGGRPHRRQQLLRRGVPP